MSYIKTLKNGEILTKKAKNRKLTPYDRFMAKKPPSTIPYSKKITITSPKSINDLQKIVDQIKSKKGVMLDLEKANQVEHQRALDFLGGAIYSLNADIKKISNSKYLITPKGMDIIFSYDNFD